jgi:hypothetical protein
MSSCPMGELFANAGSVGKRSVMKYDLYYKIVIYNVIIDLDGGKNGCY